MIPFMSWKRKLQVLVVVTFLGLLLLTISALQGVDEVTDSFKARGEATVYERTSLALLLQWLKIESASAGLQANELEQYRGQLTELISISTQLVQMSGELEGSAIEASAGNIQEHAKNYRSLRNEWLALNQKLGLSNDDGLRARLAEIINDDLRNIGLSIMDDDINQAIAGLQQMLANQGSDASSAVFEAIDSMRALVEKMGWEDNSIGEAVLNFSSTITLTNELLQQIKAIETRLGRTGASLEAAIENQNQNLHSGLIAETSQRAAKAREESIWRVAGTSTLVITVLVLTLIWTSRTLVRRLTEITGLLSRVAKGDLSHRLETGKNPHDEFNQLGRAANHMMDDVSAVIRQVIEGNRDLDTLQGELRNLMSRMTLNSEHVEMQTEQTASAVQEIAQTTTDISSRTANVNQSAHEADASALAGSRVIKTSVDNMHSLSLKIGKAHEQASLLRETGTKVNRIVDVINSLAEQTNLLALNAAIEAARAGEAGRGFSVVAEEVRSLAEKTVAATSGVAEIVDSLNRETRDICELMEQGLDEALRSQETAEQAGGAIDEITRSVGKLASELDQVLASVKGISTTTEDIAHKVEQIQVSAMESRTVRTQLENHTLNLSSQAATLTNTSSRFQL